MYVPGYGEGVAADTGSAVKGNTIDVWFESCAQGDGLGPKDGHHHPALSRPKR
jgi:3D (Asp-Asp-Asp) domain-containing protein